MECTAADIMLSDFPFVDADATVAEAELFFELDTISALPVLNPDRTVFGLLTPKNLASFYRRPLNNPQAFHAWEICDARPMLAPASSSLDDVTQALLGSAARHVLVVSDAQQLVGVIPVERLLEHHAASTHLDAAAFNPAARSPSRAGD